MLGFARPARPDGASASPSCRPVSSLPRTKATSTSTRSSRTRRPWTARSSCIDKVTALAQELPGVEHVTVDRRLLDSRGRAGLQCRHGRWCSSKPWDERDHSVFEVMGMLQPRLMSADGRDLVFCLPAASDLRAWAPPAASRWRSRTGVAWVWCNSRRCATTWSRQGFQSPIITRHQPEPACQRSRSCSSTSTARRPRRSGIPLADRCSTRCRSTWARPT